MHVTRYLFINIALAQIENVYNNHRMICIAVGTLKQLHFTNYANKKKVVYKNIYSLRFRNETIAHKRSWK